MNRHLLRFVLPVLTLLAVSASAARADEFDRIENSPYTYWVPAPTPGFAESAPGQPGYYGPAPGDYGPPPPAPPPVVVVPGFYLHFHFH